MCSIPGLPTPESGVPVFPTGRSVGVKVSCIESLQKFWCQTAENNDSLHLLMQDLQSHYSSTHPVSLAETICVARNPVDDMWYRARIVTGPHTPMVDVRFIDYGSTQRIPLKDVCPIDPAFLRLHAKAFQCCLLDPKNSSNPAAGTDAALGEFQKFVDSNASSKTGLKCVFKSVTTDEEGLPLCVVDIESSSESASKLITQKVEQEPNSPKVQSNGFNYATHNVDVGAKENVLVTSSESVNLFYCQLEKDSTLFEEVTRNVKQFTDQKNCTNLPLSLHDICLAKYTDNQWYRGKVVQVSPKLKVHFVDYGETLTLNESDTCPFPVDAGIARSAPVQAVPLGLYNVPAEVTQEVNGWFAESAVNCNFTISVVAKEGDGKLIVELFDGALNVNKMVRERIKETQQKVSNSTLQENYQKQTIDNEELKTASPKKVEEAKNNVCSRGQPMTNATQVESNITLDMSTLSIINEAGESVLAEPLIQSVHNDSKRSPNKNRNICPFKKPNMSPNKTANVYASSIVAPNYFWCQFANSEDLEVVSRLVQEASLVQEDDVFNKSLGAGSPCLALFSDQQWYRAQVIQRTDNSLHVLFVDYGNESDVDIKNVRPVTQILQELAPQAFLCSLTGFDESIGSWDDDDVYDDFYNLLVDKELRVTVSHMEENPEIATPQYAVQILCDNVFVNEAMQKYWKASTTKHVETERNGTTFVYKTPNVSKTPEEEVYASSISEPHYFWCQSADTEELHRISQLVQEAGQVQQSDVFLHTLAPGSPCLALFPADEQWYRAQVMTRVDDSLHVVFIDYGNESDVDIKNVKPIPLSLLEAAPQAFLCALSGFDESKGSWDDRVYDDLYAVLVDKPLRVTVRSVCNHKELALPQFKVEVECDGVVVNELMEKYWKRQETDVCLEEGFRSGQDEKDGKGGSQS